MVQNKRASCAHQTALPQEGVLKHVPDGLVPRIRHIDNLVNFIGPYNSNTGQRKEKIPAVLNYIFKY